MEVHQKKVKDKRNLMLIQNVPFVHLNFSTASPNGMVLWTAKVLLIFPVRESNNPVQISGPRFLRNWNRRWSFKTSLDDGGQRYIRDRNPSSWSDIRWGLARNKNVPRFEQCNSLGRPNPFPPTNQRPGKRTTKKHPVVW